MISEDVIHNGKKYIVGMGLKAKRPFDPTSDRYSSIKIKNGQTENICATYFLSRDQEWGAKGFACANILIEHPIKPEIIEEEIESLEVSVNLGMSSLLTSILSTSLLLLALV